MSLRRSAAGSAHDVPRQADRNSDAALLRRYHGEGDIEARQTLIRRHMELVERLARRYSRRGEPVEDLIQAGYVGLIKAIDRFDGEFGVALSTYAGPNILGEIKRHFRDRAWTLRVPREIQELKVRLSGVMDGLTVRLGRSPTVDELADAAQTTPEQVVEALESSRAYSAESLSQGAPEEDAADPLESIGAEEEGYGRAENREFLRKGLGRLGERERLILHLRFFEGLTQSEIAKKVGISQMHVSRLIRQSLEQLRGAIGGASARSAA
jgi:RNA polymerase sigma-B factor